MTTKPLRLAVLWVAAMTTAPPADACSCAMRPVCAVFWEADRVFIGRAEVTPLGPGAQRTRFHVDETFRGPSGDVIEIVARGLGGSCAYAFVHGTRYLVFARRAADGTLGSFYCDPTAPLNEASRSLAFVREVLRDPSRGGRIVGSVLVAESGSDQASAPLGGATITIRRDGYESSRTTDASGGYIFDDLRLGTYAISVSGARVRSIPAARVEIKGPGACATHVFRLPPG